MEVADIAVQFEAPDDLILPVADTDDDPIRLPPLIVERVAGRLLVGLQTAWADLCARAIEPNVFLEPAFALPLIQHTRRDRRPDILLVWERSGPSSYSRLVGLLPIAPRRRLHLRLASSFLHNQTSLGTPLLDRDRAEEAFATALSWLVANDEGVTALMLPALDEDGPFHAMVRTLCARQGRAVETISKHQRAILRRSIPGDAVVTCLTSSKRRKEIGRQRRRLSERGTRVYTSARTPGEIAYATERFLALEHNGWKGERGTALLAEPTLATFTRSMTRLMAHEGKCRIDAVEIDGAPVAMGIILTVGDRAHYWKTSFHEGFATLSPGVQFTLDLTQAQLSDPGVTLTDSCAMPDHPMINRLWHDRMDVVDVMIDLSPEEPDCFRRVMMLETARRRFRGTLKRMFRWAVGRSR